ncbi:MAG: hypothetical protein IIV52_05825 [Alistipes sp.]|nr:hypothetical protein [Alistipes sp.]
MMKKFWNLMLAAMVIFGAAACNDVDVEVVTPEAGLSFEATIETNETRTDVVFNEGTKKWDTVWTGNETLSVVSGWSRYDFKNSVENKNHFVCTNDGVKDLVGKKVTIKLTHDTDGNTLNSKKGKAGGHIEATVDAFDPAEGVNLQVKSAFLRYSSDYEVTLDASAQIFDYNGQVRNTITLPAGEDVWVAIKTESDVTLSYSINGEKCKEKTLDLDAKKIYNLGELGLPYAVSAKWGIAGAFNDWTAGTPEPMYEVGDMLVAFNLTKLNDGFKFVQNKGWDGAKGSKTTTAVASGEWLYSGDNDIKTADAAAYDVYFAPARSMYCIVAAGSATPEMPEVEPITWSLAGSFNNWGDTLMTATDTANLFVAKGVELKAGDEIKIKDSKTWDTSYGGGITNLEANKWMKAYFNGANIVVAKSGSYDVYFEYAEGAEYSKLYLVDAEGDYTTATEQTANGTLVPDGGEEPDPDQPAVTPGVASEWALVGAFSNWADKTMLTTTDADVVVLKNVALKAAEGFLVRKPSTDWADKYGAGNVNYIKANHYITTQKEGADMCLEADGTYDIYFNATSKNLYVMVAGTDYANATLQTVNGEEPKQEEPEVTEKVVYLKPNSNWTQSNARFAAYFWGGTTGEKWVSMTAVGDGTYEAHLPEGYDYGCNIIFCRMNPSTTANNWNNKWNQTSDLKTPTDGKNLYTVKAGTWDKGGGTWSVK